MSIFRTERGTSRFGADLGEATGSIGDSVTVLPLVVAPGSTIPASLARVAFRSTERPWLVGAIGVFAVTTNVGIAFLAGVGW